MKSVSGKGDSAVSEVIGTVLVFAIFISIFTTVSAYYIPATQTASETNYQQATISSLSDLASTIASPSLSTGSIISQNVPLGIQGGILAPARTTSLTYSTTGISGSINYGVGLSFAYTSNHPTSAILNKLLQTFPTETLVSPSAVAYDPLNSHIFVSGYGSNVIATIDLTHNTVLSYTYGGYGPKFMDLNLGSNSLYVADQKALNATKFSYITINEYSASSLSLTKSIEIPFTSKLSADITAFTVDTTNGNVYIAFHTLSGTSVVGSYIQEYSGGSLGLLENISLSTSTTITDLCAYSSGSENALIATFSSPSNRNVDNPEFMVFNPSTLSYTTDTINFSGFYSSSALIILAGKPEVTLTSAFALPSNNLLLFAFNITNQTGSTLLSSLLSYPGPGVAGIAGNSLSSSNNIVAATQFYSPAGYILNPQYISYDTFSKTFATTVGAYSKLGGSETALLYNFTESSLTNQVETSNTYTGDASQIVFAQSTSGQSYYLTTSNLTNTISRFSVTSLGTISSYNTILTNFFNGPFASLYDSFNNYLYVTDYSSGYVSVIDPDTCALIGAVSLGDGTFPTNLTYDPFNGTVYVAESQASAIAVISGTKLISTIPVSGTPVDIAFDSHDNAAYGSIQTAFGAQFINISKTGLTYSPSTYSGNAGSVAFDSYNVSNSTYGLVASSSGSYYIYDLSAGYIGQSLSGPSASYKLTLTFNTYTGAMYATSDQSAGKVYIYTESASGSFNPSSTKYLLAGPYSYASVFDAANNLLYIDNSGSSNITIFDTVTDSYFSTIWIGSTPLASSFDQENGYIFIPDYGFNKLSVIDGGFTIYNGKVGILDKGNFNFGGSISTYGPTRFITPESYMLEDGALFQNSSSGNSRLLSPVPFAVLNQSGSLYFSDVSSSFTLGTGQTNESASSYSSTSLKLQVVSEQNYTFSKGSQFYITDVYGNRYAAVTTAVFMEFFNLTLNTPYASLINSYFYAHYSGNSGQAPSSWTFSGLPITFNQAGDSISISLLHPISLAFVSVVVYNIGLLEV